MLEKVVFLKKNSYFCRILERNYTNFIYLKKRVNYVLDFGISF